MPTETLGAFTRQDLAALPWAHLHLHLVGSMDLPLLVAMAADKGIRLPPALLRPGGHDTSTARGFMRFQRLYDIARHVIATADDIDRVVDDTLRREAAAGTSWLELQVDPTGYADRFGGLVPVVETILQALHTAGDRHGVGTGLILAANRTRNPAIASTTARLAVRYREHGVVGFGLSNDERFGPAETFAQAFRIARTGGLLSVPHAGELRGAHSVLASIRVLEADRIGHGVRAVEDPRVLDELAKRGVTCEVCPSSNVALGVAESVPTVPIRQLRQAGVPVALGADDPLLFGADIADNYQQAASAHDLSRGEVADLAVCSLHASAAPAHIKAKLITAARDWVAAAPERSVPGQPGRADG